MSIDFILAKVASKAKLGYNNFIDYLSGSDLGQEYEEDVRASIVKQRIVSEFFRFVFIAAGVFVLYVGILTLVDVENPTTYHNEPFPVLTKVVSPGEELIFEMEFTIEKSAPAAVSLIWINSETGAITLGESFPADPAARRLPVGYYLIETHHTMPDTLKDGEYVLELTITQPTNWLHRSTVKVRTDEFEYEKPLP